MNAAAAWGKEYFERTADDDSVDVAPDFGDMLVDVSSEPPEQSGNDNNLPNTGKDKIARLGLCSDCRFMRRIESDRGSIFYLCRRSATDTSFPKYPRLPVLQCRGYEQKK